MTQEYRFVPADQVLEATSATCATLTPLIRARIRQLASGEVLEVLSDDPSARDGISAWCRLTGNELVGEHESPDGVRYYVRKK